MALSDREYFVALGVAYLMLDEGLDNALHILKIRRYAPQASEGINDPLLDCIQEVEREEREASFSLALEFYNLFYPHFKNLDSYIGREDYALPSRVAEFLGLPNHAKGIETKALEPIAYEGGL